MIGRAEFDELYTSSYFFDHEEDDEFYMPNPMPNVDMWKKFELLPTPPMSPRRDSDGVAESLMDTDISSIHFRLLYDKDHPPDSMRSHQDPMWSGHVMDGEIQRYSEQHPPYDSKPVTMRTSTPSVDLGVTECIDPQSVFAITLPDSNAEPICRNMGTDTPSDSEEEVDVVSVSNKNKHHKTVMSSSLLSHALSEVHTTHNYSKPHIHISYTSQNNSQKRTMKFVIPSTSLLKRNKSTDTCDTMTSAKRTKRDCASSDSPNVASPLDTVDSRTCISPRRKSRPNVESSDYDVTDTHFGPLKRNQHNVLERKRRNDLKSSFYLLRDEVPELIRLDRAPKVMILQKAQEHITELQDTQASLIREVEKHKSTRKKLQEKLNRLRCLMHVDSDVDTIL